MAIAAAVALGNFGTTAEKHLLEALHDDRTHVRVAAARGLSGHKQAIDTLVEALADPEASVLTEAANAIVEPNPLSPSARCRRLF